MAEIQLLGGGVALVDDADLHLVSRYRWRASAYEFATYATAQAGKRRISMHRLLMGEPASFVDHRNHDGLDNRRENLRLATPGQNRANSRPRAASGFKGVRRRVHRWSAQGTSGGINHYLGMHATAEEAARAYDAWAIGAHGEFAHLNFPLERAASNQAQGANQP